MRQFTQVPSSGHRADLDEIPAVAQLDPSVFVCIGKALVLSAASGHRHHGGHKQLPRDAEPEPAFVHSGIVASAYISKMANRLTGNSHDVADHGAVHINTMC